MQNLFAANKKVGPQCGHAMSLRRGALSLEETLPGKLGDGVRRA